MKNEIKSLHRADSRALPTPQALKILAPIDPLDGSGAPAHYAIEVARALGADLTLLQVADARPPDYRWLPPGLSPRGVDRFTLPGPVENTIIGLAEYLDSDIVLMSSGNYRRRLPIWNRSVTARVMKATGRPVLVTDWTRTGGSFHCRTILCALTLDGRDGAAVLQAEALARRAGGELILLSVVPDASEALIYEAFSGVPLSPSRAAERMRKIAARLSVPCRIRVMTGSLEECLRNATRHDAVDIVVANREAFDPRALFRRLNCPLLSVVEPFPAVRTIGAIVKASQPALTRPEEEPHVAARVR